LRPVEQEVVIVEDVLALLRCDIRGEWLTQLVRLVDAPRKGLGQHGIER
jgi:hypothetical protein